MPRDQKVGLALGVLLIGAVAALFFRNDRPTVRSAPALQTAARIDQSLAELPHTPYLAGQSTSADQLAARTISDPADGPILTLEAPEFNTDTTDPFAGSEPPALVGPAPDPIGAPGHAAVTGIAPQASAPEELRAPVTHDQPSATHTVKRGETLSSIAAQHLGSPARFEELFDANRDQLRDANDVRVGMKLRIPSQNTPSSNLSAVETSPARDLPPAQDQSPLALTPELQTPELLDSRGVPLPPRSDDVMELGNEPALAAPGATELSAEPAVPTAPRKFVPFNRSPLNRRGVAPGPQAAQPARKLTQAPPVTSYETIWR